MILRAEPGGRPPAPGFTLLELLVVLAIMAIVATSIPLIGRGDGTALRGFGHDLATALRGLRATALRTQEVTAFSLAPQAGGYRIGDEALTLPEGVTLSYRVSEPPLIGDTADHLAFYPDGSASGGTITLSSGGRVVTIEIGWIDGRIAVDG